MRVVRLDVGQNSYIDTIAVYELKTNVGILTNVLLFLSKVYKTFSPRFLS